MDTSWSGLIERQEEEDGVKISEDKKVSHKFSFKEEGSLTGNPTPQSLILPPSGYAVTRFYCGAELIERHFCAVYEYEGKTDLSKGYCNPKVKQGTFPR